ncbi:putative ubiquitin fusion degradation protein [Coniochaeta sp. 2T2.1]|nr:putative ubiquitin fusion degradation protein [Coniochaeta sp. 2T2.1]
MDQPNQQPAPPDAPDKETMEQIRRRRVAKLGATATPATSSDLSPKPEQAEPSTGSPAEGKENEKAPPAAEPRTKINITRAPEPTEANPFAQLANAAQPSGDAKPEASPSGNLSDSRKRRATDIDLAKGQTQTPPPPRKQTQPRAESLEDFADNMLSHIFRVTADPDRTTDSHGHKLAFLPGLNADLQESGSPLKLSIDLLDGAIVEAATATPQSTPILDYMLACWKRVTRMIKGLRNPSPEKLEVLKEAKRICFSNCIFAVTMPELFSREPNPQHDTLVPYILRDVEHEQGLCYEFFVEAVSRLDEDDSIEPLFTKAMVDISGQLSKLSMNDSFRPHVSALTTYSRFPRLVNALAKHPRFQMAVSAPNIEKDTILGPFFRISPLQPEVTRTYFAGPRTMDKGAVKNAQVALQQILAAHQEDLRSIINAFVRASTEARNKVLDWFAYAMNANHKRRALQVDPREVASDAFMMNVTVILDFLCEPFLDTTFSKVDRIDVNYFRRNPRVDIKEETKINADQAQSDAFYAQKVDGTTNFITEVFFLALAAHHYGSEAVNTKIKGLEKDIKYYEKNIAKLEAEKPKFATQPPQVQRNFNLALEKHISLLERSIALKFAMEGVLLDEKMQSRSLQFMRYVSVWLLRVASQADYRPRPDQQLTLPLPAQQPEAFSCLPEYALQDIVDNFKFVFRYIPQIILAAVGDETIALCVTFLESSEYIRNPYLKSSLVSLLFSGTWPTFHLRKGVLGDLLTNTKFANEYLLHAVMKFYIECESTGAHTQFYDKFNIRYEIFQVIKCVWSNDHYKQQLTDASRTDRDFFVRFVNLLMNDATYVLDEGLTRFPKIHDLQEELKDRTLSAQDRQKKEEELSSNESQAQSYMQLANETVGMMKLFTDAMSESFTMPEIVQRLAAMLDYNLDILAGPKSKNLKVENPDKYHFSPRTLLPEIVDIYLNLGSSPAFVEAVAADGRSYKPENFEHTSRILRVRNLKAPEELTAWDDLTKRFKTAKAILDQAELDFAGDIPPEFEDPIMGDIMHDPVVLPSKHVVDRSTIVQHLLSDPKDPYTRQPMTIDDVTPADELREQIGKWKEERRAAGRAKATAAVEKAVADAEAAAAGAAEGMDTSEG